MKLRVDALRDRLREALPVVGAEKQMLLRAAQIRIDEQGRTARLREGMVDPDGLHLAIKGYQVWAESMRPTLQKLLRGAPE
jgi:lysophospholipase L1-like esterase